MKKKVWHRVRAPVAWRPKPGDVIEGTFLRTDVREGTYGPYRIHYVKVGPNIVFISGTVLNDLFALLKDDTKVKVVYLGKQRTQDGAKEFKKFELYTQEAIEFKLVEVA